MWCKNFWRKPKQIATILRTRNTNTKRNFFLHATFLSNKLCFANLIWLFIWIVLNRIRIIWILFVTITNHMTTETERKYMLTNVHIDTILLFIANENIKPWIDEMRKCSCCMPKQINWHEKNPLWHFEKVFNSNQHVRWSYVAAATTLLWNLFIN